MQRLRLRNRLVFPELNVISTNSVRVHVEPKVMAVFLELAKYPGEVVSKAQLIEVVWGGAFVCEDVVANAVSLLRRALVDDAKDPSLIQTIPKHGYRLLAPVVQEPAEVSIPESTFGGNFNGCAVRDLDAQRDDLAQSVLRVRYLRHEETVVSLNTASAYCEEIIRQEPNCAAAYAEFALTLFLLEKLGAVPREDIEAKVRTAIDRALCLDERASMTLVCLAKLEYRYDWEWEQAERHFQEAIRSSPFDADVFTESSTLFSVMRRFDESLALLRRACLLDPISPSARLQAGHTNYASGRWAAAASHYRRLLQFTPQHVFARWGFADSLVQEGKLHDAMAVLEEGMFMTVTGPHPLLVTSLLRTKECVQPHAKSPCELPQVDQQTKDPVLLAEFYSSTGELTKAFGRLNEAADVRHYRLSAVNMFPQFEPMRNDARYGRLLKRMGLRD